MLTLPTQLNDAELLRYSRQILLPQWDLAAQLRLKNSHVLLIGMGGLGCTSAELLVRAGVGQISFLDDDTVEASNLQRQVLFQTDDIGKTKVEAAVQRLRLANPHSQIQGYHTRADAQTLAHYVSQVDLVFDGSDNFVTREAVNAACVKANIPLISAAAIGMQGQLTCIIPHQTGCYYCLFGKGHEDARRCADTGILTTVVTLMGNLQAHQALLYLGLQRTPLAGKLLLWEGLTMQQRIIHYSKDSQCPVCGG